MKGQREEISMPLEDKIPQLDERSFEQIRAQALLRIPRYTPEWTDFNESDPGVTLVELFAWLTEMMLYRMNQIPERNYLMFLQQLGMELRPAKPATAHLVFTPEAGAQVGPVPEGSQFGAQSQDGSEMKFFETVEGLSLIRLPLSDVQVFDGAAFNVMTPANEQTNESFRPFGWQPQPGSALYLGFAPFDPPAPEPLFPQQMRWRVYLPANLTAGRPLACKEIGDNPAPASPVQLAWEYRPQANDRIWRRLQVDEDESVAFTREGSITLQGPGEVALTMEGRVPEPRYWLRVRLVDIAYPAGREPVIDFIRPNVARAENRVTVRSEEVGISDGSPDQEFSLQFRPVAPGSLVLEVLDPADDLRNGPPPWTKKDFLYASGPDDRHYRLNAAASVIRFGDGTNGRIPSAGAEIVALEYRHGGGTAGNVAVGSIQTPLSLLTGISEVTNPRPASGGLDEESLEDFRRNAPLRLRHRGRAVASSDFATLAMEAGEFGHAVALSLFHPDFPEVEVPGAITVVVVPKNDEISPQPSPDQIEAVCRYLEPRRLLTTELRVKGPEYVFIQVQAQVAVEPSAAFDRVRMEIIRAINTSLDPLGRDWNVISGQGELTGETGEIDVIPLGGEFGRDLYPTSLFGIIQGVNLVKSILHLAVNGQENENLSEPIRVRPDELVVGMADHQITIVPYQEED
jgi:predicted phage baseplate assembly protein